MVSRVIFGILFSFQSHKTIILIDDSRSLGVILYQMCMNELPFRGDDEIKFKSTPKLSKEFEDLNKLFEE
jgi:hypothetical protein